MGTLQYMAPEQLEGRRRTRAPTSSPSAPSCTRCDRPKGVRGDDTGSLIGSIMRGEPRPPSALTPMTPPALERLVLTCLAKDPDDRRQSIRDVLLDLEWIAKGGGKLRLRPPLGRSALALDGRHGGARARGNRHGVDGARPASHARPSNHAQLRDAAWHRERAPSGAAHPVSRRPQRGVRRLRDGWWPIALDPKPGLRGGSQPPGTSGARFPFWSPDSRFLGFFADGKLRKIDAAGGPPQVLCAATDPFGGTWNREGLILFGDGGTRTIEKVAASGGAPEAVTKLGPTDEGHRWPVFLPDGRHFVLLMDAERTEIIIWGSPRSTRWRSRPCST